jgi:RNA polymerase sigma factor (TIGR02999 family)
MGNVTELLDQWSRGDDEAFKSLMPLVYGELHQLAGHYLSHERSGHTLQPTALVHEAYLRLSGLREMRLNNRTHFYGACAEVMRRVLVDHARRNNAVKRGGPDKADFRVAALEPSIDLRLDLLALDEALTKLQSFAPNKAKVVELRYFGGLSVEETAEVMTVSPATVKRHWRFARAWLLRTLGGSPSGGPAAASTASDTSEE